MKIVKRDTSEFNFWKNNKLSGHFKLSKDELIVLFIKWLSQKEYAWVDHYEIDVCVQMFMMDGLNSVGNGAPEYRAMEGLLRKYRSEYLTAMQPK